MATEAQIKANQENAKKSTGPTTEEGKQRSSMNAMTHGIFTKIPFLPGENEDQFKALEEDLIKTYQPTDAVEMHLVQRIYLTLIRQIRLREAEAAKLKISMIPEVLTESVNKLLKNSTKKEYLAIDLSEQVIHYYQHYQAVLKEIEGSRFEEFHVPYETIEQKMPHVFSLLKRKFKEKYPSYYDSDIKRPDIIKNLLEALRFEAHGYLITHKSNLVGISLFSDLKIVNRIPQGHDMALFIKYQVQLDTDLARIMKMLKDHRDNKAKVIEGEVIDKVAA